MTHYVYETTNNITGKKYIGKHSTECDFDKDTYFGSGTVISRALKKYGKENFSKRILRICESEEDAYIAEAEEIEKVKAYDSDEYYNIAKGGEGCNCGKKVEKSPPSQKIIPIIFNPSDYIAQIRNDFNDAAGGTMFKLEYLAGYIKYIGGSDDDIINDLKIIFRHISFYEKYSKEKIGQIINDILYRISCESNDSLRSKYHFEINIYSSQLVSINTIGDPIVRKVAFWLLIFYKSFDLDRSGYVASDLKNLHRLVSDYGTYIDKDEFSSTINKLIDIGYVKFNYEFSKFKILPPFCNESGEKYFLSRINKDTALLLRYVEGDKDIVRCVRCGNAMHTNRARNRKYCNMCCSYIRKAPYRIKTCECCGKKFIVGANVRNKNKCNACQEIHRRECKRKWKRKHDN